ncbi:MAG: cytochrome c [Gallionella sp.]
MKQFIIVASMLSIVAGHVYAADIEAGKAKVTEICSACHGMDGNSISHDFPRLAGQNEDYIRNALNLYQTGGRNNPIMVGMAASLSKQDIENVAAYFSSQKGLIVKPEH